MAAQLRIYGCFPQALTILHVGMLGNRQVVIGISEGICVTRIIAPSMRDFSRR